MPPIAFVRLEKVTNLSTERGTQALAVVVVLVVVLVVALVVVLVVALVVVLGERAWTGCTRSCDMTQQSTIIERRAIAKEAR
jgi:hypothetical protein